jgi:hypothetical protein
MTLNAAGDDLATSVRDRLDQLTNTPLLGSVSRIIAVECSASLCQRHQVSLKDFPLRLAVPRCPRFLA